MKILRKLLKLFSPSTETQYRSDTEVVRTIRTKHVIDRYDEMLNESSARRRRPIDAREGQSKT